ncbi:MAG: hypothetical protein C5B56_04910 [Proteobacteria bacterium]|nr:MAG: hypothetical protein C5B56_04910 [Pseudomonadota bacterium]
MQRAMSARIATSFVLAGLSAQILVPSTSTGLAQEPCAGHKDLTNPRPATSCLAPGAQVYQSPDKALSAIVLPVDVSLYLTPDMESRVVIYETTGKTISSKDFSI